MAIFSSTTEIRLPEMIDEALMDYAREAPRPTPDRASSAKRFRSLRALFPLRSASAKEAISSIAHPSTI